MRLRLAIKWRRLLDVHNFRGSEMLYECRSLPSVVLVIYVMDCAVLHIIRLYFLFAPLLTLGGHDWQWSPSLTIAVPFSPMLNSVLCLSMGRLHLKRG